jgi:hypothetical protein
MPYEEIENLKQRIAELERRADELDSVDSDEIPVEFKDLNDKE